ncbi:MAG: nucleoid occlusion factor SlmA [Gammaproteobacteria bacterium]|nr:nucleoid occlusion factor SlmA [Gammaproteobacteria bacterium]
MPQRRRNRKDEILQALAAMLEGSPGERITTARLAAQLGVSEAALYRHFPSKARMFEGLIAFMEETLLSRINRICEEEQHTLPRVRQTLQLILLFAERNPGFCRLLTGDALQGEHERLRAAIGTLFDRIETALKQMLREHVLREGVSLGNDERQLANLMLAYVEGRIAQFVRSDFTRLPSSDFDVQWSALARLFGARLVAVT